MGFCLGGKFAYLSAVRHPIDAAVTYYGVEIDQYLNEADRLKCPILNSRIQLCGDLVINRVVCDELYRQRGEQESADACDDIGSGDRKQPQQPATGKGLNVTSSTNSKTPAITTSARRSPSARVR